MIRLADWPPDIQTFTSSKVPRLSLDDRVPVVEAFYRRSQYWPAASVAR